MVELKDGWKKRPEGSSRAGMSPAADRLQYWAGRTRHLLSREPRVWSVWAVAYLQFISPNKKWVSSRQRQGQVNKWQRNPELRLPELCCMMARGRIEVILQEISAEFPKPSLLDNWTQGLNKLILLLVALLWARGRERGPMSSLCSTFSTKISFQNLSKVYHSPPVKRRTQSSSDDHGIESCNSQRLQVPNRSVS